MNFDKRKGPNFGFYRESASKSQLLRKLSIPIAVTVLLSLCLTSCGSSKNSQATPIPTETVYVTASPSITSIPAETPLENLEARRANCSLIKKWINYENDPNLEKFWGAKNTYEFYEEMEKKFWQEVQSGDTSSSVLLKLRDLAYDQDWLLAPPMDSYVTEDNFAQYKGPSGGTYNDAASWEILRAVTSVCTTYRDTQLASTFAAALLM